jgi:hypothetical protein
MGLDVWFRDDVARMLAAAHETLQASSHGAPPLDPERAEAYHQGFEDALRALAVAFGLVGPGSRQNGNGP